MTLKDEIIKTKKGLLAWHQERTIFDTTNMLCEIMEAEGITRAELAKKLGTTRSFVTQLLDGSTNMTLRTVSDAFTMLGYEFHPSCKPRADYSSEFSDIIPFYSQQVLTDIEGDGPTVEFPEAINLLVESKVG